MAPQSSHPSEGDLKEDQRKEWASCAGGRAVAPLPVQDPGDPKISLEARVGAPSLGPATWSNINLSALLILNFKRSGKKSPPGYQAAAPHPHPGCPPEYNSQMALGSLRSDGSQAF